MKTIFFDLDGTILDTLEDLKNAVNYALNFYNYPKKDLEFVRKAIGNGTQVLIRRCTPKDIDESKYLDVFHCFKNYYLNHYADCTRAYAGINDLLKALKGKCKIAVVSNKDNDLTQKLITKEFPGLFDFIQGSYLDKPKKPDPYLIDSIIKSNGLDKRDCLYIGDTDVDKQSAINVGLDYRLVSYGYRTKEELEKMCPNDTPFDSVEKLSNYLLKWVNL